MNKLSLYLFSEEHLPSPSANQDGFADPQPSTSQDGPVCQVISAPLKKKWHPDQLYSDSSDEESDTERASVIPRSPAVQNLLVKKSGTKSEYYTILILFKCSTWQICL